MRQTYNFSLLETKCHIIIRMSYFTYLHFYNLPSEVGGAISIIAGGDQGGGLDHPAQQGVSPGAAVAGVGRGGELPGGSAAGPSRLLPHQLGSVH